MAMEDLSVEHVMIVEDDPAAQELIRGLVSQTFAARITVVGTLAEARDHAATDPADVILLDLGLPDAHDDHDVVSEVVHWKSAPCVIVLTGQADPAVGRAAVQRGADEFMHKADLSSTTLFRAISQALERHGLSLERARQQELLVARLDDLDAYVASISHDLRSPLATSESMLALVRSQPALLDAPEHVRDLLERMARVLERGRTFADELLQEARVGQEARSPLDFEELAKHAIDVAGLDAGDVEIDNLPKDLWGRPAAITQVLINLLANAARHADAVAPVIRLSGRRMPRSAWLIVDDNGAGIPTEERDAIFDPGVSAANSSGLGLATVRRHVGQFGGRVWVDENDLGGARFVVELPARDHRRVTPASVRPPTEPLTVANL